MIWEARCLPVLRQMLWPFWLCIFSFVVLDVWAIRRAIDVVGIGVHHCSTSMTYNFMGTLSELLKFEIYNTIIINYWNLQAVLVETLAICQKVRKRAHHPTMAYRLVLTVRWTPYASFLRKASNFPLHRPTTQIWIRKAFIITKCKGEAAELYFRGQQDVPLGDSSGTDSVSPKHHRIACVEPILRPKVCLKRFAIHILCQKK